MYEDTCPLLRKRGYLWCNKIGSKYICAPSWQQQKEHTPGVLVGTGAPGLVTRGRSTAGADVGPEAMEELRLIATVEKKKLLWRNSNCQGERRQLWPLIRWLILQKGNLQNIAPKSRQAMTFTQLCWRETHSQTQSWLWGFSKRAIYRRFLGSPITQSHGSSCLMPLL